MDKQKKRRIFIIGIVVALVLVAIPLINLQSSNRKLNALLDLGEKYLEDLQYESAIAVFDEAIAIEPKCAEAYLGKAKAQYALKLYQDAINTLREGIERVDDPKELEDFLQQILDELSAENKVESESEVNETEVVLEEAHTPIMLNYKQITRRVDTDDPIIQLEVLGDHNGKYIWESSDPECATVSDTGLVTCQPVEGYAVITVTTEDGRFRGNAYRDYCEIRISSDEQSESVRVVLDDEDENQKQYLVARLSDAENGQMAEIIQDVYYSGDVSIPEHLTYQNKIIPITNISRYAFYWSYEMKSIFIPAFIESVGENEYYCQNPFGFCLNLEEIMVDDENANFQVLDGVLYSKDGKKLIAYPSAKADSTYMIPREVEIIYQDAFSGCSNLEEILVEEGNQYYKSVDGALIDKREKELIAYPAGNKKISYTIPEDVVDIMEGVFYGSNLEEIVCGSIEWIYSSQFMGCDNLKRIKCAQGARVISMSVYDDVDNVEIVGLDTMENLEELTFTLSETQDIHEFVALQGLKRLSINIKGRNLDLQVLQELKNLTDLQIYGMDHIKDISWLASMESLEKVNISANENLDEDFDFKVFEKLKNIESLEIWGIRTLSDLSWLAGMENLKYLNLNMEMSEIEDLTPLLEADKLERVSIYSSQGDITDEIKTQIEHIKEERADKYFYIFG